MTFLQILYEWQLATESFFLKYINFPQILNLVLGTQCIGNEIIQRHFLRVFVFFKIILLGSESIYMRHEIFLGFSLHSHQLQDVETDGWFYWLK